MAGAKTFSTSVSSPQYLLTGSGSGTISILPQAAAGTYNFNLPTTAGTSGYFLTSAGGVGSPMTWTDPATVSGVLTITGNSGGAESPSGGNFNIVGTGSITTVGSAATETIQLTGLTNHNVLIGAGTATITNVSPSATSGVPLISQGSSADPAFGTAVVAGGGTGNTTFTAYSVICAGTTSTGAFQNVSGVGTSGQILKSNGAAALPSWSSAAAVGGSLVLIQSQTVSNVASVTFTSGLNSYGVILITITNCLTATGSPNINMDFSADGGSTYFNSGLFCAINTHTYSSTTLTNTNSSSTAPIGVTVLGNSVYSGEIWMRGLNNGSATIGYGGSANWFDGTNIQFGDIFGETGGNVGTNALKFSAASGNISGTFTIYGLSTS
jgi:hypothetical protein